MYTKSTLTHDLSTLTVFFLFLVALSMVASLMGFCPCGLPAIMRNKYFVVVVERILNKCVSRTDTNPPFAFQTAFPRGTDFSVSTGRVKKLHTLLVSLYF